MSQQSWFLPSKSKFAFERSADKVPVNAKGHAYLWTFTFIEVLDVADGRRRWSKFLRRLRESVKRSGKLFDGLRVFELHPGGHGLHIHVLTSCFLHVNFVRALWKRVGGGRIHAKAIPYERRHYIGKYLTKQGRPPCLRRARMWQAFGGQESCKVKDVKIESLWTRTYAILSATFSVFRGLRWYERLQAVENVLTFRPWYYGLGVLPSACDGHCNLPPELMQTSLGLGLETVLITD